MRIRHVLFGVYFLTILPISSGQSKYWIGNEAANLHTQILNQSPIKCSKWLKSCSYELSEEQLVSLTRLGVEVSPVLTFAPLYHPFKKPTLGFALEQVGAEKFLEMGLTGKGVKIGIIDGGYLGADKNEALKMFFDRKQVRYYKDYITPNLVEYGGLSGLDDNHGTEVWQLIGGYNASKDILYGLATEATYYLARTDHGGYEKKIEEDYLIQALESMASMDIRLVNISLGYNLGFNNIEDNYQPTEMDGTSKLAQAVNFAAEKKGILVVVSAGNEGNLEWQTLSTPGDAQYALTVGASKLNVWDKMDYSSIGPDYIDYIKPDIAVYSTLGTSYSAPIVTGMAACLMQMDSTLTNFEIIDLFKKAGNFYPYPNNYLGYGVPTCKELMKVYDQEPRDSPETRQVHKKTTIIPVPKSTKYVVAFHKRDSRIVLSQEVFRSPGKKVKIKRPEGVSQTSVLLGHDIVEIFWK
ncbi:S8 family serine peptidase [Marinoscillum sp.]|uniref:S8 family serine peptidase n=1 Tax=Marinoscillum sp. TaxID=2024838 RepID=UPI003BA995E4